MVYTLSCLKLKQGSGRNTEIEIGGYMDRLIITKNRQGLFNVEKIKDEMLVCRLENLTSEVTMGIIVDSSDCTIECMGSLGHALSSDSKEITVYTNPFKVEI